jgi:hypothetical protein
MKRILILLALVAMSCTKQESMEKLTARVFERAAVQMRNLDANLDSAAIQDPGKVLFPRSIRNDGKFWYTDHQWWCTGFYPGSLWLMYEYTGDESFRELALKYQTPLEPLRYHKDDHDVGFQIMCSYGNCLRLTGDQECIPIIIDGAHSLATRFSPVVGCTRSWRQKKNWDFIVIIDNMMNLELLLKAAELEGNDTLKNMALTHARTTIKNHFRENFSTYHLVDYSTETGEVLGKCTVQGLADDSAWARGQAWGLYGYTMMYRFTKEQDMLDQAIGIAEYVIPRLPRDYVPFWDFDTPDAPDDVRDASAGALIAGALIELSSYVDKKKSDKYLDAAEKILRALASEEYLAEEGEQYGFLLRHGTGNKNKDYEVDKPLSYADYYFLEALIRWNQL